MFKGLMMAMLVGCLFDPWAAVRKIEGNRRVALSQTGTLGFIFCYKFWWPLRLDGISGEIEKKLLGQPNHIICIFFSVSFLLVLFVSVIRLPEGSVGRNGVQSMRTLKHGKKLEEGRLDKLG